jgi:hypothetical protein
MSSNVSGPNLFSVVPREMLLAATALLSLGTGWASASSSSAAWNPPPPAMADGLCARACEVSACLAFEAFDQASEAQCVSEVAHRATDLRRAGPDSACVQKCAVHGLPVDILLLSSSDTASLVVP